MRESMRYDTNKYQLRESILNRMLEIINNQKESVSGGTVFYGDSITEYFDIDKYMSEIDVKYNCGIGGITSDMLLHFIDEGVIKYKPNVVFLMIGTNDLGNTIMASPRDIALNVKEMVEIIHYNLPECKIHVYLLNPLKTPYFQGVSPVLCSNLMYLPLFLPLRAETRANFYSPPTTLSSSLAEVRFASLVA